MGNVDDRDFLPALARSLFGKLFGDRGYLSQPLFDKHLLRKHSVIETVNNQLKNISQIEHSRHRCP